MLPSIAVPSNMPKLTMLKKIQAFFEQINEIDGQIEPHAKLRDDIVAAANAAIKAADEQFNASTAGLRVQRTSLIEELGEFVTENRGRLRRLSKTEITLPGGKIKFKLAGRSLNTEKADISGLVAELDSNPSPAAKQFLHYVPQLDRNAMAAANKYWLGVFADFGAFAARHLTISVQPNSERAAITASKTPFPLVPRFFPEED